MKHFFLLFVDTLIISCGENGVKTLLPLDIQIATPESTDPIVLDKFLVNISMYRLVFTGNFGERRADLLRNESNSNYSVENIPFDPALRIKVEVIGKAWNSNEKNWVENQILAVGETMQSVIWVEGKSDPVKIICKLTEIGEETHEEIFSQHSN